jgi:hypothetical protein
MLLINKKIRYYVTMIFRIWFVAVKMCVRLLGYSAL